MIGVEEEYGRMKRLCGAEITLRDSDLQQFVSSKTNRSISFRVEVRQHEGVSLTVVQINKIQQRPIFLAEKFGRLKSNVVYIRRGSSTDEATPDEIAKMGRDEGIAQQKEKQAEQFWKVFKMFLPKLEQKILYLKNTNHIFESTIVENRLPVAEANNLLQQANEINLADDFHSQFEKIVEKVRVIDGYMNLELKNSINGFLISILKKKISTAWYTNLRSNI